MMIYLWKKCSLFLLQLLLVTSKCSAGIVFGSDSRQDDVANHPLARLLLSRFASSAPKAGSTKNLGFLRKLVDTATAAAAEVTGSTNDGGAAMRHEFGPGADWSCTIESNQAKDFDSCTLSEASKKVEGGCSWCPLGSSAGVCLRAGQAALVNELDNEKVLHLDCYSDNTDVIDETSTAFWDEALSCLPHSKTDCGGDHGGHTCTYCTVSDPAMGLCLSKDFWDNLLVAQSLEDFDHDVSTGDQISLNQVVHCSEDHADETATDFVDDNLSSKKCGLEIVDEVVNEHECYTKEGCTVVENPFPGLLGSTSGMHCVTPQQQQATVWAVEVLRSMGWEDDLKSYE